VWQPMFSSEYSDNQFIIFKYIGGDLKSPPIFAYILQRSCYYFDDWITIMSAA
jgi:hypothetical protein